MKKGWKRSINQDAFDAFEEVRGRLKQEIAEKEGRRLLQRVGYQLLLIQDCLPLLIGLGIVFVLSRTAINTLFPDLIQFLQPLLVVVLLTRVAVRLAVEEKPAKILAVVLKWQPFWVCPCRSCMRIPANLLSHQSEHLYS